MPKLDDSDIAAVPEAVNQPRRRFSIQLVWLVPLVAALIGGGLVVKSWMQYRRAITISFKSGEGLQAGRTKIKYKDVQVGEVRDIAIAPDTTKVLVTAYMERGAEGFLRDDTSFWVVRPRIMGGSVTGLATLREGAFIALDVGKSEQRRKDFIGLEVPPVVNTDEPGSRYHLRAADLGSLNIGSPVFFRRVEVGQIAAFELEKEGKGVLLTVFVKAPYDRYVTADTVFWQASGIDMRISASGVAINTESIASILLGGVAFESPETSGSPQNGAGSYVLYGSREEAYRHARSAMILRMTFRETVKGLAVGAPVDFKGVTVGEVVRIDLEVSPKGTFHVPVAVRIHPERLRSRPAGATRLDDELFLKGLVRRGLRARLKSGNLLTGQRFIDLDFVTGIGPGSVVNLSEFPVIEGGNDELQDTVQRLARKLERLPLEEMAGEVKKSVSDLDKAIRSADQMIRRLDREVTPEVKETLQAARRVMGGADQLLTRDSPLQSELREAVRQVGEAARSVRILAEFLEQHPESVLRGKPEDSQ